MRAALWLGVATSLLVLASCDSKAPPVSRPDPVFLEQQAAVAHDTQGTDYLEALRNQNLKVGQPYARLVIPKIGVDLWVIEGVTEDALGAGAGHYPQADYPSSGYPGGDGNIAIAGHRKSFGAVFQDLNLLNQGDVARLETPLGSYTYRMIAPFAGHSNPWTTTVSDYTVLAATTKPSLTLTTDEPPSSTDGRLIARLELVKT